MKASTTEQRHAHSLLFLALINTMARSELGEKRFLWFTDYSQSIIRGSQAGNSVQEHQTVTVKEMLLTGLLSLADSATFLTQPKPTFSGMGTAHSGHMPIISNQEKRLTDVPTCQSDGGNSSFEISSSQVYLGLCHFDIN